MPYAWQTGRPPFPWIQDQRESGAREVTWQFDTLRKVPPCLLSFTMPRPVAHRHGRIRRDSDKTQTVQTEPSRFLCLPLELDLWWLGHHFHIIFDYLADTWLSSNTWIQLRKVKQLHTVPQSLYRAYGMPPKITIMSKTICLFLALNEAHRCKWLCSFNTFTDMTLDTWYDNKMLSSMIRYNDPALNIFQVSRCNALKDKTTKKARISWIEYCGLRPYSN